MEQNPSWNIDSSLDSQLMPQLINITPVFYLSK
jgi:hypothetical protein